MPFKCNADLCTTDQWCQGEQINCPTLCGGKTFTSMNSCSGVSFDIQYPVCVCMVISHNALYSHVHLSPNLNLQFSPTYTKANSPSQPLGRPHLQLHVQQRHRSHKYTPILGYPPQFDLQSNLRQLRQSESRIQQPVRQVRNTQSQRRPRSN